MTANTPTQLNFTVVSEYETTSVSVIIQVWNYSSSAYVTSGEGYVSYLSANPNETELLSIDTSSQFYTSGGSAKIKLTGLKSTSAQFQQKTNQVKLEYSYGSFPNYDYVLGIVNQVANNWTINLEAYSDSGIGRLSNCTISFHDGSTGDQIIVNGGVMTQSKGPQYDLLSSSTIYISVNNLQATTSATTYLYVYLRIVPMNSSPFNVLKITFRVT
jgi:hypothetical protein